MWSATRQAFAMTVSVGLAPVPVGNGRRGRRPAGEPVVNRLEIVHAAGSLLDPVRG